MVWTQYTSGKFTMICNKPFIQPIERAFPFFLPQEKEKKKEEKCKKRRRRKRSRKKEFNIDGLLF